MGVFLEKILRHSNSVQFHSILKKVNEFQHVPEAEKHECTEYNLRKLSFQSKLISKEIQ